MQVWAVHGGDIGAAAVPEPETYALLLAGLGLMGFMASRKRINRPVCPCRLRASGNRKRPSAEGALRDSCYAHHEQRKPLRSPLPPV